MGQTEAKLALSRFIAVTARQEPRPPSLGHFAQYSPWAVWPMIDANSAC